MLALFEPSGLIGNPRLDWLKMWNDFLANHPSKLLFIPRTISTAGQYIQHMQAALDQMNIKLHYVIDDLTGLTGQAIIAATIKGQRDPVQIAKLRDCDQELLATAEVAPFIRQSVRTPSDSAST